MAVTRVDHQRFADPASWVPGLLLGPLLLFAQAAAAQTGTAPGTAPNPFWVTAERPRILLTPAVRQRLRERAAARDPAWLGLRARCDGYLHGKVEWPDGDCYPPPGNIGEGYQGSDYYEALMNLALCYQVARLAEPPRARAYGDKGADVLVKMSEPAGPHAVDPLRDSGFGIRFYGVGMGIGYDWLYDALSPEQRVRVYTALNRWIYGFAEKGFGRNHPQGNYFAGYYAGKLLGSLATLGDNDQARSQLQLWLDRLHKGLVQPYYAAHLLGGGWPEGWNYGLNGTVNMCLPVLAIKTGKGIDLVHDRAAPFSFPIDQGQHLMHFTWPSRRTLDDRQIQFEGDNPSSAQPWFFTVMAGLLRMWQDESAPVFKSYARAVRAAQKDRAQPWQELLFWDEAAPEKDFHTLPLSYLSRGMNTIAMRSSWDEDAVWGSFTSGAYINFPDSGEQYYDQGSLAIVRGGRPLLVNAPAALMRHTPGTQDGSRMDDVIYNDIYQGGSRTMFNIFYVNQPTPFGQEVRIPEEARTRVEGFEDGGRYVVMRGRYLQDMYRHRGRLRPLVQWTRDVAYLRPQLFVVHDRTEIADPGADQWQAFHLPRLPVEGTAPGKGLRRLDVGQGPSFAGAVTTLLPADHKISLVSVFKRDKVFRLEVRPGGPGASQRWLTVFDAARSAAEVTPALRLSPADGNVKGGDFVGAVLRGATNQVVLFGPVTDERRGSTLERLGNKVSRIFGGEPEKERGPSEIRYTVPAAPTVHLLTGLPPGTGYAVRVSVTGDSHEVRIVPGSGLTSSSAGVLHFRVEVGGAVGP